MAQAPSNGERDAPHEGVGVGANQPEHSAGSFVLPFAEIRTGDGMGALCVKCNYSLVGLERDLCPECGTTFDLGDPRTFNNSGIPLGSILRFELAAPVWPVIVVSVLAIAWLFWTLRTPESATRLWEKDGLTACAGVLALRGLQLLMRRLVRLRFDDAPFLRRLRTRWPAWPFLLLFMVSSVVTARQEVPLAAAFRLSERALDQLADLALADPNAAGSLAPTSAGLFRIEAVEVHGEDTVVLFTRTLGPTRYGFIRQPGSDSGVVSPDDLGVHGLNYRQRLSHLDRGWFVLWHYWGWS